MGSIRMNSTSLVRSGKSQGTKLQLHWDIRFIQIDSIPKGLVLPKQKEYGSKQLDHHLKTSLSDFFPPPAGRLATIDHGDTQFPTSQIAAMPEQTLSTLRYIRPIYVPKLFIPFSHLTESRIMKVSLSHCLQCK